MPSLAHLLRASSSHGAPFDARAACSIAAQVCTHLERPHGAVAPSAILVDWDGSVTLERSGHAPSSALPYMAPERMAGAEPDARSDVHAVAMVLLELVTGRPVRRAAGLTFAGDFPVELVELLDRSSSPDPNRRHSSPREMGAWLALAEEESGGAMSREELAGWLVERFGRERAPVARPVSVVAGRRWRLGAAAGLLALIGAGAAVIARPLVGASGDEAPAATMVVDAPAGGSAMTTGAMAPSMTTGAMASGTTAPSMTSGPMASAATAPSMTSGGMAPAATSPSMDGSLAAGSMVTEGAASSVKALPVGSPGMASSMSAAAMTADDAEPDAVSGPATASEPARKARRKRTRAARKAVADVDTAATADAAMAPAAAPAASCPMTQAPSNTMAPVTSDAMAPASKGAPPRSSDERATAK